MSAQVQTAMAFDFGEKRIGVATANSIARIASPLCTIPNTQDQSLITNIEQLIKQHNVSVIVLGLPRNLEGEETDQTRQIYNFANDLKYFNIPIKFQDEAVTSVHAETELKARGKAYTKADVDALAATYILDDFINQNKEFDG